MIRPLCTLVTILALSASASAFDCVDLVEIYQAKLADDPTTGLRDIFPGWKGAKSLPLMPKDDPASNSTELICDETRQLERLRYAWSWEGDTVDEIELARTVASMLELSDLLAPNNLAVLLAFGRSSESHAIEVEDLPGPYKVFVQNTDFPAGGGVLTLVIEPD
jgi:hypothetical protein